MSRFDAASDAVKAGRRGILLLGALGVTASCATVSPDDLDSELEQVRSEIRQEISEGDEAVEQRLSERFDAMEDRLASLEGELGALSDEFHVTVERFESALRFNAPIHFSFDSDDIEEDHQEILDQFASVVSEYYDDAVFTVEGFTDSAGSQAYNQNLGERRAQSVMEYLAESGIPSDQLRAVSYGAAETRQIVPGESGPGQDGWQNRRVAIVVDFVAGDAPPAVAENEDEG